MRFPSINDVSAELRRINKQESADDGDDGGIDVRLQVMPDSTWTVNWGLSDYDQDHRGFWGSSSVPGDNRRFDSKDIARDLIEQAREHKATGGDDGVSDEPRVEVDEHVDARGKTRLDKLRADLPPGYDVYTYSPGDGVTRYRFFKNASPKQDYFGPANGIYTALGYAEAEAFAQGLGEAGVNEVGARRKRPPERPAAQERKHSMTYGELPPFEQFEQDIRRPDPDNNDHPYWPEYTRFPMELVSSREIELAERYGLPEFRAERHRTGRNTGVRGFNADEHEMYGFLEYLVEQLNDGDDEAGNLASSIMTTLGYEWF